jgi:hypothetical protein
MSNKLDFTHVSVHPAPLNHNDEKKAREQCADARDILEACKDSGLSKSQIYRAIYYHKRSLENVLNTLTDTLGD